MPWLVVEGSGSWSPNLGREWVDDPTRFPPAFAPIDPETGNRKHGYFRDRAKLYRAGAHKVDEEVAKQAIATGYAWLIVMPDDREPVIEDIGQPTGMLTPEDVREGKGAGIRVTNAKAPELPPEPDPVDAPVFEHACPWCDDTYPSTASLDRHTEFNHPAHHAMGDERAEAVAQAIAEEKEALRRMSDHTEPVPVWEREAVEQAGLPAAVEPEPVIPPPPPAPSE